MPQFGDSLKMHKTKGKIKSELVLLIEPKIDHRIKLIAYV